MAEAVEVGEEEEEEFGEPALASVCLVTLAWMLLPTAGAVAAFMRFGEFLAR